MTKTRNQGHGYLSKSRKKNSRCPAYRGKAEIQGVEFWLSGWVKEGPGGKFLSLAFTRMPDGQGAKSET